MARINLNRHTITKQQYDALSRADLARLNGWCWGSCGGCLKLNEHTGKAMWRSGRIQVIESDGQPSVLDLKHKQSAKVEVDVEQQPEAA